MARFQFVARTADGAIQRGVETAASAPAVVSAIRARGAVVIDVKLEANDGLTMQQVLEAINPASWLPVRSVDIETSLAQLAVMLRAGLTLLSAIKNVVEQAPRLSVRNLWLKVSRNVQQGSSLADSLKAHPVFPPLVIQLVRIGEQTGNLETVLSRGAKIMEGRRQLRNTLINALIYPSIVVIMATGVATFMVLSVIPKLEVFLTQLGRRLPPMTQSLLDISYIVRNYWLHGLVGLAVSVAVFLVVYWTPAGRLFVDRCLLRVPLIGHLFRLAATSLLARSLSILLQSGVTLLEALRTVELLPANRYMRQVISNARDEVIRGGSLADGLRQRGGYLPMLSAMVAVGESAGTLDEVLDETATFHEDQLQVAIRRFSAFIEPVIVVVVGGIVGYVYIAFFVALFAAAGPGGR